MNANQATFPIAPMARVLGVPTAGYYAWLKRPPSDRAVADAALLQRIRTVHASSRKTYGAPRIHAALRAIGQRHGRKRVARLMRRAGLVGACHRGSGPVTTRRDKEGRPAPATALRCDPSQRPGLAIHRHRLRQPLPIAFGNRCHEAGVRPSMGSVGDAYDNAMAESFFSTLECELLARRRFASQAEARMACFSFIEGFYNPFRLHSALGYQSPINEEEEQTQAFKAAA